MSSSTAIQIECLRRLLRPFVRYCLRHGQTIQIVVGTLKAVFLEMAEEELQRAGKKINASRLSMMTGIDRKELTRLERRRSTPSDEPSGNILSRVIGLWEQDGRYTTKTGAPRVLNYQGDNSEFNELVASISTHVGPKAVLFELERGGLVEKTPRGLRLIGRRYTFKRSTEEGYELLSQSINALILAAEQNIAGANKLKNPHLHTEYDEIYQVRLPEVREWLLKENRALHERARSFLARHDSVINPDPKIKKSGKARVIFGSFSVSHIDPESDSN